MDDFGSVVYLDVPKTGSSFVSKFLEECLNLDRRDFTKHGRVRHGYNPAAFYFVSVRHPFAQYKSLYQYGCGKKGGVFGRLVKDGKRELYSGDAEGFNEWLRFVLDSRNANLLGENYEKVNNDLIGFQTFRFLVLSFQFPLLKLERVNTYSELLSVYERNNIAKAVIRNESLNADLKRLCERELKPFVDRKCVERILSGEEKVNPSSEIALTMEDLAEDVYGSLRNKERFLFEKYYS